MGTLRPALSVAVSSFHGYRVGVPRRLRSRGVLRAASGPGERQCSEPANHIAAPGFVPHWSPASLGRSAKHSLLLGGVAPEFGVFLSRGTVRASQIQRGCASTPRRIDHLSAITIRSDQPSWWVFRPLWLTLDGLEAC